MATKYDRADAIAKHIIAEHGALVTLADAIKQYFVCRDTTPLDDWDNRNVEIIGQLVRGRDVFYGKALALPVHMRSPYLLELYDKLQQSHMYDFEPLPPLSTLFYKAEAERRKAAEEIEAARVSLREATERALADRATV